MNLGLVRRNCLAHFSKDGACTCIIKLKSRFGFEAIVPIRGEWPHPYRFERNSIPWSWGPIALSVGKNVIDSVPDWQGGSLNVLKLMDLLESFP